MNNRRQKSRPAAAVATKAANKPMSIIPESAFYASAVSALKAEAVRNGSARLTVFYTDGNPTGFTTGHNRSRRAGAEGRNGRNP